MKDIKRSCYAGKRPGIRSLWFVHIDEVEKITVTAKDTVSVTLKQGGRWGKIHGKNTTSASERDRRYDNRIQTTLPGWTAEEAVSIHDLVHGRYLVKWTDHAGDTWLCGYGEPMHLTFSETAPDTPAEYQGIVFTFSCESEFGFLKLVE